MADTFKLAFSCLQSLCHQTTWAGQGQVPINQGPHSMGHTLHYSVCKGAWEVQ